MAFETISGQQVFSAATGQTFIFGDFFTVFYGETVSPSIYKWSQLLSITENSAGYVFYTLDKTYRLEKTAFTSSVEYLRIRAIIEGQIAINRNIRYKHLERILPLKYLYRNGIVGDDAYFIKGVYSEKEINSCNIALASTKVGRLIVLFGIIFAAAMFYFLMIHYGNVDTNWFYYLPIALFASTIVCLVIYLIIAVLARHKYNKVLKVDPALSEEISIAITPEGFSAVESFCHTGCDLIPWKEATFFIETHSGLVIIRDNKSVFWLPNSFVPKNIQPAIKNLISSRVKQR